MDGPGHAWATGAPPVGRTLTLRLPVFILMVGSEHQLGETVFEEVALSQEPLNSDELGVKT